MDQKRNWYANWFHLVFVGMTGVHGTNLTREPKLSGPNVDMENYVFLLQPTASRIGNYTQLIPSLLKVVTVYIRYVRNEKKCVPVRTVHTGNGWMW